MTASTASPALLQCDAHGQVNAERTREHVERHARELGSTGADAIVAFVARPDIDTCARILALWRAERTMLPLHPRWDPALRESVLSMFDGRRRGGVGEEEHPLQLRSVESLSAVALLMPTSGTTATPKLARLPREALLAALRAHSAHIGWHPGDRWILSLPTAHIGGMSILLRCFEAGVPVVVPPDQFDVLAWHRCLCAQRVTLASLVPTQLRAFVDQRLRPPASLRVVLVGGAACPPSLYDAACALGWPLRRTYGFTEACSQIATELSTHGGMIPLPGVELRTDELGGLLVRTPQLFAGYVGESVRDREGWYATGDRGRLSEDGRLILEGRLDSMIITGGENVSPHEVETRLTQLPGVHEACVVGVDDPTWGQVVGAVLVAAEPFDAVAFEAAQRTWPVHLRVRLFRCVQALPLGPNGKVDRQSARDVLRQD